MNGEGYRDPTAEKAMRGAADITKVRSFFYQIRSEQREIDLLQERIEETNAALFPKAIRYDKEKVQTSPGDIITDQMAELADYTNLMEKKIRRLTARRAYAQKLINRLDDSTERQVLGLYFLSTKRIKMWKVADKIGYSEHRAWEICRAGLRHINMS